MKHYYFIGFSLSLIILSCNGRKNENSNETKIGNDTISKNEIVSNFQNETIKDSIADFQEFWTVFRKAVIENDTSKLIQFAKFPIETRGPQDSDPIVKYDRKDFIRVFQKYLNQDSGMGIDGENEFDVFKKIEIIDKSQSKYYIIEKGAARVGDLQFIEINNEWKLTFAYLSYPIIEELRKK